MRGLFLMIASLLAYLGALFLSNALLANGIGSEAIRIAIALLPMLPALFICWTIVRVVRGLDEMQRKLQFEALAIAFTGTALLTFGYGFLEGLGFPRLSMFAVWPVMAGLWVIGVLVGRIRFG